jgi:hypothetical protein
VAARSGDDAIEWRKRTGRAEMRDECCSFACDFGELPELVAFNKPLTANALAWQSLFSEVASNLFRGSLEHACSLRNGE